MATLSQLFEAIVEQSIEDGFNIGTKMFMEELNQDLITKEKLYEMSEDEIYEHLFKGTIGKKIIEENADLSEDSIVDIVTEMRMAGEI